MLINPICLIPIHVQHNAYAIGLPHSNASHQSIRIQSSFKCIHHTIQPILLKSQRTKPATCPLLPPLPRQEKVEKSAYTDSISLFELQMPFPSPKDAVKLHAIASKCACILALCINLPYCKPSPNQKKKVVFVERKRVD